MSTIYRAGTIKRDRRTKTRLDVPDEQILTCCAMTIPGAFAILLPMTDPRLDEPVEKTDRGYRHVRPDGKLRRAGRLPFTG